MPVYVVGLGSNLGDRGRFLRLALDALRAHRGVSVDAVSPVYETDPIGPPQPSYWNAAARLTSDLAPEPMLDVLLAIEAELGRIRRERWGPRTIDLDILAWSGPDQNGARVTVPHPRLHERAFALVPLLDVAPPNAARYHAMWVALGAPRLPIALRTL